MNNIDNNLRPKSLNSFFGQKEIISQLKAFIYSAKSRKTVLDHILFYGPPGLGKTTLAYIISNEMKGNIITITASSIEKGNELISILGQLNPGDFLFIDPPYTVQHNNSFVKYNEKMFCWQDQIRLRNAVIRAINRKVKLILTNANHPSILGLYANFNIHIVTRASVIAASNQNRGKYEEIVVTYP